LSCISIDATVKRGGWGPHRCWPIEGAAVRVGRAAPHSVWSRVRRVRVVWPPPWPRHTWSPTSAWPGPRLCPLWQHVRGWAIHFPAVVGTSSPSTTTGPRRARRRP